MMTRCTHGRLSCWSDACRATARNTGSTRSTGSTSLRSNLGAPSLDITGGGLSIGVGGGLSIDPSDGSLGMQIAPGLTFDFDGR